jgi:hypothetical protein
MTHENLVMTAAFSTAQGARILQALKGGTETDELYGTVAGSILGAETGYVPCRKNISTKPVTKIFRMDSGRRIFHPKCISWS